MGSAPLTGWAGQQEGVEVSLCPVSEAAEVSAAYPENTNPESGGRCLKNTRQGNGDHEMLEVGSASLHGKLDY